MHCDQSKFCRHRRQDHNINVSMIASLNFGSKTSESNYVFGSHMHFFQSIFDHRDFDTPPPRVTSLKSLCFKRHIVCISQSCTLEEVASQYIERSVPICQHCQQTFSQDFIYVYIIFCSSCLYAGDRCYKVSPTSDGNTIHIAITCEINNHDEI